MADYMKKAIKGSVIIFSFFITTQIISYLVRFLFARNLTTTEFGLFYACFGFISFFTIFKEFGLNESLTKYIPEFLVKKGEADIKNSIAYALIIQLAVTLLISLVIFSLSGYLSDVYFHNKLASVIIKILLIGFLFDSITVVIKNSFLGFQRHALYSSIIFFKMILILVVSLFLFKYELGVFSPIVAYAISPFLVAVIFVPIFIRKVFPQFLKIRSSYNPELLKKISSYGFVVMIGMAGSTLLGYTDTLILTYFSITSVALYNVVLPIANIISYLAIAISNTLFPLVSELWAKKHVPLLKKGVELLYRTVFLVVLPIALALFAFPDVTIRLLFGQKFLDQQIVLFGKNFIASTLTLQILIIGVLFTVMFIINNNILNGIGRPKLTTKTVYIAASLNLVINLILIPSLGIVGAAIATTISSILMAILTVHFLKKILNVYLPINHWIKTFFAGVIFILVVYLLKGLLLIKNALTEAVFVVLVAVFIYVTLLFLLRLLSLSEIKELVRRLKIKGA